MKRDRTIIFGHLEIGDALVLNGMVRHYAKDGHTVELFTGYNSHTIVRRMYSDLPNVRVWWLMDYRELGHPRWLRMSNVIKLGYYAPPECLFKPERWDSDMYRIAGLPFRMKWDNFKLPDALLGPTPTPQKVLLLHDDPSRGFTLDMKRIPSRPGYSVVPITRRSDFWSWLPEVRAAEELHFADSVFLNLADLLWSKNLLCAKRLVMHRYARHSVPPVVRGPWEIL